MLVVVCISSKPPLFIFPEPLPSGVESEGFLLTVNVSDLLVQPMPAEKIPITKRAMLNLKIICLYSGELILFEPELAIGLSLLRLSIIK
jgi:hypothetical protein